jgi:hypothetical protein
MRASIGDSGPYLTLTNENGAASTGKVDEKKNYRARLAKCDRNAQPHRHPDRLVQRHLLGALRRGSGQRRFWPSRSRWKMVPAGDSSEPCTIREDSNDLQIDCAQLATTTGRIDGPTHFKIKWGARSIGATVTADRNHIHWDDQTYWTRSTLYESASK